MEIKAIAAELRTLFLVELGNLIGEYTKITPEEQKSIKQIVDILERLDVEAKYDTRLESLLQLSKFLERYSVEAVEFYLWYRTYIDKSIEIQEADEYIKTIEAKGYVEVNDVLIYEDGACLDRYTEELIKNQLLTDSHHIKRLIDIDEIIEHWMEGDKVEDMIDELKCCSLEELLENPIKEAYITENSKVIMYVELDL